MDLGKRNILSKKFPANTRSLLKQLKNWRKNTMASVPTGLNPLYDAVFEVNMLQDAKAKTGKEVKKLDE